jgi:hypothetical protein
MSFVTASGEGLRVTDSGQSAVNYLGVIGYGTGQPVRFGAGGSDANIGVLATTKGTSNFSIYTNNFGQEQLRVAHTASAVNYVQVTGAATGGRPVISAQGSDAAVQLQITAKGGSSIVFSGNANNTTFGIGHVSSSTNYLNVAPSIAGAAPILSSQGTDTNIDLTLTPKGTGNVRFGTYTASMALTVQGYVEIKDSGGTVRKLAVIA